MCKVVSVKYFRSNNIIAYSFNLLILLHQPRGILCNKNVTAANQNENATRSILEVASSPIVSIPKTILALDKLKDNLNGVLDDFESIADGGRKDSIVKAHINN